MNKPRVLIVDDDPNISRLSRLILDTTGRFETRVENFSTRALQTTREFRPDIILMDIDMPCKDGAEVAEEVRADTSITQPRILFFTALVSRRECGDNPLERGAEQYLAKPVDPDVLIGVIDRLNASRTPAFA